jgi:hypothetical protein
MVEALVGAEVVEAATLEWVVLAAAATAAAQKAEKAAAMAATEAKVATEAKAAMAEVARVVARAAEAAEVAAARSTPNNPNIEARCTFPPTPTSAMHTSLRMALGAGAARTVAVEVIQVASQAALQAAL